MATQADRLNLRGVEKGRNVCIGVPMRVVQIQGTNAVCARGDAFQTIDLSLIEGAEEGGYVLVFMDRAIEVISAEEAGRIDQALQAVALAQSGQLSANDADAAQTIDHLFADLIEQGPQLPPHLQQKRTTEEQH